MTLASARVQFRGVAHRSHTAQKQLAMLTTQFPPREATNRRRAHEAPLFDASAWQRILETVRTQHSSLNRTWFEQLVRGSSPTASSR